MFYKSTSGEGRNIDFLFKIAKYEGSEGDSDDDCETCNHYSDLFLSSTVSKANKIFRTAERSQK